MRGYAKLPGKVLEAVSTLLELVEPLPSSKEELFQCMGENIDSRAVILTFQGATLRIREDAGKLIRPMAHKHMTVLTTHEHRAVHHERGDGDGSPLPERQRVATLGVPHNSDVVRERGRYCL